MMLIVHKFFDLKLGKIIANSKLAALLTEASLNSSFLAEILNFRSWCKFFRHIDQVRKQLGLKYKN
ncbi:hypothetical protein BpHYR1_053300 [Brachionus plicatilis]|uniref:Uncharacterized protein n=1 Tax=Brachionus plicatilis TaxID=10195 RepID=A0A3M7Q6S6_BRAPC|nr:hypothetical protein BpHYR1_053300 [Brachionus plicatilis]